METRKQWRKANDINFLHLNIDQRRMIKEKIESYVLSKENELRKKLKLPTFLTYQEFLDRDEDPETLDEEYNVLNEAMNILSDLIDIQSEPLIASLIKTN